MLTIKKFSFWRKTFFLLKNYRSLEIIFFLWINLPSTIVRNFPGGRNDVCFIFTIFFLLTIDQNSSIVIFITISILANARINIFESFRRIRHVFTENFAQDEKNFPGIVAQRLARFFRHRQRTASQYLNIVICK